RFKLVNDSLGHRAGDDLLRQAAARLRAAAAGYPQVVGLGHLDGDEFALTLELAAEGSHLDLVTAVARRVMEEIALPIEVDDHMVVLAASAGAAMFPDHAMDGDDLLGCAERAMYRAKAS